MVEFLASNGNRFRIVPVIKNNFIGPKFPLPAATTKCLPGTPSAGLGIRYMEYFVPPSERVLEWIAQTYEGVLGGKVRQSDDGQSIRVVFGCSENPQFLVYSVQESVGQYTGDHLCIYVNDLLGMYSRARNVMIGKENPKNVSIVWNNPCLKMKYDTVEQVKQLNEFRFKDFLNFETGEVVYQLEHEVRSLAHPGFIQGEVFLA